MQLFHWPYSSFAVNQQIDPLHTVPLTGQATLEPSKPERIHHGLERNQQTFKTGE